MLAVSLTLGGCRETAARMIPKAGVHLFSHSCPGGVLAVGDSLQLTATVMISNSHAGMSGPFDNRMLYTSSDNPGAFDWHVSHPPPSTPTAEYEAAGKADVTRDGVLIGRDTGVVYLNAISAGKSQYRVEMRIVPRVVRFALTPTDTAVQVGDTIWLRATVQLDGRWHVGDVFAWNEHRHIESGGPVSRVEPDPDAPRRDPLSFPLVAERAGIARVTACLGGARVDTATIRVSGDPIVVNRDVPPRFRFLPGDTNTFDGEEVSGRVRILNERLHNGPYRWRVQMGDGTMYEDSVGTRGSYSAFGMARHVFARHRYFEPGRYDVVVTVTDSAGRSTDAGVTYVVQARRFEAMVLPPASGGPISLSDDEPDLAIAVLTDTARRLWAPHISGAKVLTEMAGFPPLLFGRTEFDPERDGRRRVTRDVNGDGPKDVIFLLDERELMRNGDLRVGRNRISVRGVIQGVNRPNHPSGIYYQRVEAEVEFTAVP